MSPLFDDQLSLFPDYVPPSPTGDWVSDITADDPDPWAYLEESQEIPELRGHTVENLHPKSQFPKGKLNQAIRELSAWEPKDLELLKDAIDGLLSAQVIRVHHGDELHPKQPGEDEEKKPRGYFEDKPINGCGPYRYLRFRHKGRHKSIYIGKTPTP